jgi:hypothetical protein
MIAHGCEAK